MQAAFLLRFQEECDSVEANGATSGTRTETKIHREEPDNDPGCDGSSVLPRHQSPMLATRTHTAAGPPKEVSDEDDDPVELPRPLPRRNSHTVTNTFTYVKAEASDEDKDAYSNYGIMN